MNLVREFANKYNVTVLLKGHTTIISNGQMIYLVTTGTPGMATAGSGDVLDGILTGLLAYQEFNLLTIAAAVHLNGLAGILASKENTDIAMIASDTISKIKEAIKIIRES